MTDAWCETPASRILIVEDNDDLRRVLTEILQYEGYSVISVPSAEEALVMLAEFNQPPELVLSDILLDGMDGCAFLKLIRERKELAAMPVLFLSGQTKEQDICSDTSLEPDAFVEKPFTIQHLMATIKQFIDQGRRPSN